MTPHSILREFSQPLPVDGSKLSQQGRTPLWNSMGSHSCSRATVRRRGESTSKRLRFPSFQGRERPRLPPLETNRIWLSWPFSKEERICWDFPMDSQGPSPEEYRSKDKSERKNYPSRRLRKRHDSSVIHGAWSCRNLGSSQAWNVSFYCRGSGPCT
jgi:hypothetical protein